MGDTGSPFPAGGKLLAAGWRGLFSPYRVYILSEHRATQHIEVSTQLQVFLVALVMVFVAWTTYSFFVLPVNKSALERKDAELLRIQSHYEERIALLQHTQETLNSRINQLQGRFLEITQDLEQRHKDLSDFLGRRERVRQKLDTLEKQTTPTQVKEEETSTNQIMPLKERYGLRGYRTRPSWHKLVWSAPQITDAISDNTALFPYLLSKTGHPELDAIPQRLERINQLQQATLSRLREEIARDLVKLDKIVRTTPLTQRELTHLRAIPQNSNAGGPFLPTSQRPGTTTQQFQDISRDLQNTDRLSHIVLLLPFHKPLTGPYVITSPFGMRLDPLKGVPAMHSGVDMGGPAEGSFVHATKPGIVTIARETTAYGKLVEIDHGGDIKTRYGHLSEILVESGERIALQQPIGRLGSTGRSTGPHLHYEIRIKGKALNPVPFLKAGKRYVLKQK